jgi:hypothetical protein
MLRAFGPRVVVGGKRHVPGLQPLGSVRQLTQAFGLGFYVAGLRPWGVMLRALGLGCYVAGLRPGVVVGGKRHVPGLQPLGSVRQLTQAFGLGFYVAGLRPSGVLEEAAVDADMDGLLCCGPSGLGGGVGGSCG